VTCQIVRGIAQSIDQLLLCMGLFSIFWLEARVAWPWGWDCGLPSRSSRGRRPAFAAPVRLRFRCAQATPDTTLRPSGSHVAAPRVARRAKRGGPGRTRTCNQTVMSGGISIRFVDFPVFLLVLIAFVVFQSGCFWCETGAVQRCSRRQTGNALRLLGEKRKSYTAVAAKRLLRLVKGYRSSQQPLESSGWDRGAFQRGNQRRRDRMI